MAQKQQHNFDFSRAGKPSRAGTTPAPAPGRRPISSATAAKGVGGSLTIPIPTQQEAESMARDLSVMSPSSVFHVFARPEDEGGGYGVNRGGPARFGQDLLTIQNGRVIARAATVSAGIEANTGKQFVSPPALSPVQFETSGGRKDVC